MNVTVSKDFKNVAKDVGSNFIYAPLYAVALSAFAIVSPLAVPLSMITTGDSLSKTIERLPGVIHEASNDMARHFKFLS